MRSGAMKRVCQSVFRTTSLLVDIARCSRYHLGTRNRTAHRIPVGPAHQPQSYSRHPPTVVAHRQHSGLFDFDSWICRPASIGMVTGLYAQPSSPSRRNCSPRRRSRRPLSPQPNRYCPPQEGVAKPACKAWDAAPDPRRPDLTWQPDSGPAQRREDSEPRRHPISSVGPS